ncbi:hypothetical protein PsorP6_010708 [Peronosclerospora sorghi]|uniref:Uncharacterized protein n=1 Tax=Peronosclerospora sorghi TaxID=230839 RepID=A0ACC0VVR4_9STRA|nr:hypothetical protein PsorP6_010708 [Peronosclerospora sorghi]
MVMQGVARELLEFVVDERRDFDQDCRGEVPLWLRQLLERWRDGDLDLEGSTSSDNSPRDDFAIEREICTLCDKALVFERKAVFGQWCPFAAGEPFSTLSCGHCFHDECLIHKLNEAMRCPSCGKNESVTT